MVIRFHCACCIVYYPWWNIINISLPLHAIMQMEIHHHQSDHSIMHCCYVNCDWVGIPCFKYTQILMVWVILNKQWWYSTLCVIVSKRLWGKLRTCEVPAQRPLKRITWPQAQTQNPRNVIWNRNPFSSSYISLIAWPLTSASRLAEEFLAILLQYMPT